MEQLSVYGEDSTPSQNTDQESDQDKNPFVDFSTMPDLSKDGDAASPSSVPSGPVTCHLDLVSTIPSPALAGPQDFAGVLPVPLPQRSQMRISYSVQD